jgi:hypothetical protein
MPPKLPDSLKPKLKSTTQTFKNIIPQIIPTDTVDVYDVVFNLQMPEITDGYGDYYCSDKLSIQLGYKIYEKKLTTNYFSSTIGQGQETSCILTPPIEMSKVAAEYDTTKYESASESQTNITPIKSSGVYFTTYDSLNIGFQKVFVATFTDLKSVFTNLSDITTKTGEYLNQSRAVNQSINKSKKIEQDTVIALLDAIIKGLQESKSKIATVDASEYFNYIKTNIPIEKQAYTDAETENNTTSTADSVSKAALGKNPNCIIAKEAAKAAKITIATSASVWAAIESAYKPIEPLFDANLKENLSTILENNIKTAIESLEKAKIDVASYFDSSKALALAEAKTKTKLDAKSKETPTSDVSEKSGEDEHYESTEKFKKDVETKLNAALASVNFVESKIQEIHIKEESISKLFTPFDDKKFMKNIGDNTNLQGTYFSHILSRKLNITDKESSIFKSYTSSYTDRSNVSNFLMNSETVQEKVIEYSPDLTSTSVAYVNPKFNVMQFDFNLYDYTLKESGGITKRKSKSGSHDPNHPSLLLLLKQNQYFSIVFKNITIPFDVSEIGADTVMVSLEIKNNPQIGMIKPNDMYSIFYNNFFIYDSVQISNIFNAVITVKDFFFSVNDMLDALKSSDKYEEKLKAMQKISRMFLVYYIKFLNSKNNKRNDFDETYKKMLADIETAKNKTQELFSKVNTPSTDKKTLTDNVSVANEDIISFSSIFAFQKINDFRKQLTQALSRQLRYSGISKVNDELIMKTLNEMANKKNTLLDPVQDISSMDIPITQSKTITSKDLLNISDSKVGTGLLTLSRGGNENYYKQQGGAIPLTEMSTVENWNYIVPMCMASAGTGLNNMVVTIDKKILKESDTDETGLTSVDIQVGDTIRFVSKEGKLTYALVCGFKPGKKNKGKKTTDEKTGEKIKVDDTDKSKEYSMDMIDFRKTNIELMDVLQSQELKRLAPLQFLNVTNLRGIKYLPFTYNDTDYSYAGSLDSDRKAVNISKNGSLKAGLQGKFTFRCDISDIPLLPNGYKYSRLTKLGEKIKSLGRSLYPFPTQADIGKDMNIPEYSLSSYMTLDKVITPLNFDPVISYLKERSDSDLNNPDSMIKELVKIMQKNGLNVSDGCDNSKFKKIQAADIEKRKTEFDNMSLVIQNAFYTKCMVNGVVDPDKAIPFIQDLYNRTVKEGVFFNTNGISLLTVPQIVYAFNLIPNDLDQNMKLLLLALSQPTVYPIDKRRQDTIDSIDSSSSKNDSNDLIVQHGGATKDEAVAIISYAIDKIAKQGFATPDVIKLYNQTLDSVSIGFNVEEEQNKMKQTMETTAAAVASGALVVLTPAQKKAQEIIDKQNSSYTARAKNALTSAGNAVSSTLGSLFKRTPKTMVADGLPISTGDSCGNNTNITCNGEDLIISVSIKLSDLVSSCVDPDMIGHLNRALVAAAIPSGSAPPLLTYADADAEANKAEEERLKAQAEAKKVEEERLKAEAEAKKKAEEERLKAEAEGKKKAEERLKAEAEGLSITDTNATIQQPEAEEAAEKERLKKKATFEKEKSEEKENLEKEKLEKEKLETAEKKRIAREEEFLQYGEVTSNNKETKEERDARVDAWRKRMRLSPIDRRGGSKKRNNNSKSNKSKRNNKSSKRKTRKVTSSKNKKVKFIK